MCARQVDPHRREDDDGDGKGPGRLDRVEDAVEGFAGEIVEGFEETIDRALPPHLRARAWARKRKSTHILWQAGVLLVGFGLVLAGIAMLVLPGPGWATIILGFIVLASEYAWARRLLEPVRRWARKAANAAMDPRVRRRNIAILVAVTVAGVGLATWYVVAFGFTLQPVLDLILV
jgi:uncharacterized protein (TIGR02611 family)